MQERRSTLTIGIANARFPAKADSSRMPESNHFKLAQSKPNEIAIDDFTRQRSWSQLLDVNARRLRRCPRDERQTNR